MLATKAMHEREGKLFNFKIVIYQTLVAQPGVCRALQATQRNRQYTDTQEVCIVEAALHTAERSRLAPPPLLISYVYIYTYNGDGAHTMFFLMQAINQAGI